MPGPLAAVALGLELANSASGLYHSLKGGGGGQPTMPAQLPEPNYDFLRWLVERGNVPSYARGTSYQGGGLSLVGENGPELAPLASGPVIPMDASQDTSGPEALLMQMLLNAHGEPDTNPVATTAAQHPDRTGILATLAKGLGPSPFTPGSGSAGFLTELIAHALAGRNKRRPNIAGPLVAALAATGGNIAANRELHAQSEQEAYNTRQRAEAVRKTQNDVMTTRMLVTDAARRLAQERYDKKKAAAEQIFPDITGQAGRKLTGPEYNAAQGQHESLKERFLSGQLSPAEQRTYLAGERAIAEAGSQGAPKISPRGLIMAATLWAKTGQMVPAGMGQAGVEFRSRIIDKAGELFPNIDIATNIATFGADKTTLAALTKLSTSAKAFEQTALKNSDLLLSVAKRIPNAGPLGNMVIRPGLRLLGSKDVTDFNTALSVVVPEFSRILANPTLVGVVSVEARKDMKAVVSGYFTYDQLAGAIDILKLDARNRIGSYDEAMKAARDAISATPGEPGLPGARPPLSEFGPPGKP